VIIVAGLLVPAVLPEFGGVVLRPFRDADAGMLQDLATDSYVPQIGSLPADATRQEALDFIARQHDRWATGVGYSFCIADLANEAPLGTAGLWVAELVNGRASVGYTVAPSARRRGVAVRALRALTTFGWTLPELYRIELYVEPWNAASIRVAEKAGYEREGLLRSHQVIGGRRVDMVLHAVVREEARTRGLSGRP